MRLCKFQIKNYKNLENIDFTWDDIIILIGENNTGKSSVLEALDWFLSGKQISDTLLYRNEKTDEGNAIELIGTFDNLSSIDKQQVAIRGRTFEDQWILRKKYWINAEMKKASTQYFSYGEVQKFEEWPENERSWSNWPTPYNTYIEQVRQELGNRVSTEAKNRLKEILIEANSSLCLITNDWIPDPGGGGGWKSNANSIIPKYILVPAVYDATLEGKSKERQSMTTYGEILSLLIEKKLANREEVKKLKTTIKQVKALFQPDPENPEWKQAKEVIDFQNELSALLSKVIESKAFLEPGDISIPDIILPNTTLWIDDGMKTKISGQGHGLQRTLIMSLLQMLVDYENVPVAEEGDTGEASEETFRRSIVFAIEEPELYMHPQIERKVRDTLYDLARGEAYQVITSTHSPVFLDMAEKHSAIVRMEIKDDRKIVKKQVIEEIFTGDDAADRKKRLRMITEFDPAVNELFFAKKVILVEGVTEIAVFQKAAELMGLFDTNSHAKRDVTFVNCHGKEAILSFLEVLNHFEVEYIVFHDEDQDNKGGNAPQVNKAIGELVQSPNNRRMFSPNDLESLLGYDAGKKDKPIRALEKIEELAASDSIPSEFQEHVKVAWGVQ